MMNASDITYDITSDLIAKILAGDTFRLALRDGNKIYERVFILQSGYNDIYLYSHTLNIYKHIIKNNSSMDIVYKTQSMPDASTTNLAVFKTISILEASGYKLVESLEEVW